jgi:rhodanese-related sulfurtransferase
MDLQPLDDWLSTLDAAFWASGNWRFTVDEFIERMQAGEDIALLDLREPQERAFVTLPFALPMPLGELPRRWHEIPRDRPVLTFCSGDLRATMAFSYLRVRGYDNVRILTGGFTGLMGSLSLATVTKMFDAQGMA